MGYEKWKAGIVAELRSKRQWGIWTCAIFDGGVYGIRTWEDGREEVIQIA